MKKSLLCLLLALTLCVAMLLPAAATDVTSTSTTPVTMTVEAIEPPPIPTYTLSVPASVEFAFDSEKTAYDFGEVKIYDAQDFYYDTDTVSLTITHDDLINQADPTKTVAYGLEVYGSIFGGGVSWYPIEKSPIASSEYTNSRFAFHVMDSTNYKNRENAPNSVDRYTAWGGSYSKENPYYFRFDAYQTMTLRLRLNNDPRPVDGTYLSNITFNAKLTY